MGSFIAVVGGGALNIWNFFEILIFLHLNCNIVIQIKINVSCSFFFNFFEEQSLASQLSSGILKTPCTSEEDTCVLECLIGWPYTQTIKKNKQKFKNLGGGSDRFVKIPFKCTNNSLNISLKYYCSVFPIVLPEKDCKM